jgi:tRNA dimethylallyltransferase
MLKKHKVIAVVGPTSSGKTGVAVEIAQLLNGEIVSTDSRQIYKGLDIGSGKVTRVEMRGVPHHLLDVASPLRTMSVAQYQRMAKNAVGGILKRGNIPVLCGGTGLYVDTILNNQSFPAVPPDNALRRKLGKLSATELFEKLKKLDAVRAKDIDAKNPHRLIRAIEIATALGSVPPLVKNESSYESIIIGLNLPREEIQQRIHARLVTRLRRGMVAEAKRLHASGLSWKRMEAFGLDYRYLALFLQKKITKESMMHTIERESWLYVKRQMVWFKRNKNIHWFRPDQTKEIYKLVKDFLENK